jgi:hypothetical protein
VRRGGTALTLITAALRTHIARADVLEFGCVALARVMVSTKENQRAARTGGAIVAIVAALRAFPAAAEVQRFGCHALGSACEGVRENQLAAAAAGGLQVAIAAIRTHTSNMHVQCAGCTTLGDLIADVPPNQSRAGELGGVEAMVASLRARVLPLPSESAHYFKCWCDTTARLLKDDPSSRRKAVAAGAVELLVAHMRAPEDVLRPMFYWACCVLRAFLIGSGHEARLITASALEALEAHHAEAAHTEEHRLELIRDLQPAARRHDAARCAVASCQRCAAARTCGVMCALPGCGARSRDGGAKKLLRCGTCRAACYCGPAHQREDWGRHKGACGAPSRDDSEAAGASGC